MSGTTTTIDAVAERSPSGHARKEATDPVPGPGDPVHTTQRPSDARFAAALDHALTVTRSALDEHLARAVARADDAGPQVAELWEGLGNQVGGKLVRPRLVLAAYLGLGGEELDAAVPVAAAQELLHTAMLVHDDLLDHDESRRGRPNLAGATRSRLAEAGVTGSAAAVHVQAAAVLGGDLAISGAFELVVSSAADPLVRLEVTRQLVRAVQAAVAGEVLDVSGQLRSPLDSEPELVAELKTATYTCVVPLVSGAILAGADLAVRERLEACGRALGIAFQLVDDLLGVFGDPQVTGKSVISDLREGKRTLLLACAYRAAAPEDLVLLDRYVGQADLSEADADVVREIMRRTGAPHAVRATVVRHLDEAREAASGLPGPLRRYLTQLADSFAGRVA